MYSKIRQHVSATSVIAAVALFLALGGGAWAAKKHYRITSVKQIKPSVVKQLKGKRGRRGRRGPVGPEGSTGAQGAQGPAGDKGEKGDEGKEGKEGKTGFVEALPEGATLTGVWGTSGGEAKIGENEFKDASIVSISFAFPLASAPILYYLKASEPTGASVEPDGTTAEITEAQFEEKCPGSSSEPEADPGFLCVYTDFEAGVTYAYVFAGSFPALRPRTLGAAMYFQIGLEGLAIGTWAVTAP